MNELWKDINGFKGKYQVSNTGKIRSLNYNNTGKIKELKQKINARTGLCEVTLSKNNKAYHFLVQRLVAETFFGHFEGQVMHLNGNLQDNSVENLKIALNRSQIHYKMYKNGHRKGIPTRYNITYNGKQYKKITDIPKDYGVDTAMFSKRISRGWDIDLALKVKKQTKNKGRRPLFYEYCGDWYTLDELAKINGLNKNIITKRLERNWSLYEAVSVPKLRG